MFWEKKLDINVVTLLLLHVIKQEKTLYIMKIKLKKLLYNYTYNAVANNHFVMDIMLLVCVMIG